MAPNRKSSASTLTSRAKGLGTRLGAPAEPQTKDPLVAAMARAAAPAKADPEKVAKVKAALGAKPSRTASGNVAAVRPAAKPLAKPATPVAARGAPSVARASTVVSRPAAPAARTSPGFSRSPEVRRLADPPKADTRDEPRRRYPRSELSVRARLSLVGRPDRSFEATLPTENISVGGVFFQSTFFLKIGTELEVALELGNDKRPVRVRGQVVRVEHLSGVSGFAVRFSEYLDGSEVALATYFLSPRLRGFLQEYAKARGQSLTPEWLERTTDVLAAWELRRAELGGDVWGDTQA